MADFFTTASRASTKANFAGLGQPVTLIPPAGEPVSVVAIVRQTLTLTTEFGPVIEDRDSIAFRLAECQPVAGDRVFVSDSNTWYRLERLTPRGDDHIVRRFYALEIAAPVYRLVTADGDALVTADSDYLMAA